MSRAQRARVRRVKRNRRAAFAVCVLVFAFLFAVLFSNRKVTAQKPASYKYYTEITVGRHDTLCSIAARYMTEEYSSQREYIDEIREINELGYDIQYGQHIIVPYYDTVLK